MVVAGSLTGCSSNKSASENASSASSAASSAATSATSAASSAATSATDAAKGNPPPGAAMVTIDGQDQHVQGSVVCSAAAGNVQIAIGNATQGIGAQLSDADPPEVKQVGLGNVDGTALGYTAGTPQGEASATKDGNTYKIKGTATGVNLSNPTQQVTKPFEIDVTCP
jgi:lipoprotein LpqH